MAFAVRGFVNGSRRCGPHRLPRRLMPSFLSQNVQRSIWQPRSARCCILPA